MALTVKKKKSKVLYTETYGVWYTQHVSRGCIYGEGERDAKETIWKNRKSKS